MDILKKIEQKVRLDQITINYFEMDHETQAIKLKVTELDQPENTYKCRVKPGDNLLLAYLDLKKYLNDYANLNLPNENDLKLAYEQELNSELNSNFEEGEESIKNRLQKTILEAPSVEKIQLNKVQKSIIDETDFFILTFDIFNNKTKNFQSTSIRIFANLNPGKTEIEEHDYKCFQEAVSLFFIELKIYYHDFKAELELKYLEKTRAAYLDASQGNLFGELTDFDKKLLLKKTREINEIMRLEKV